MAASAQSAAAGSGAKAGDGQDGVTDAGNGGPLPPGTTGREKLPRLIDELRDEDIPLTLELARRLLGERPPRPNRLT